jgi:hypothetical protein
MKLRLLGLLLVCLTGGASAAQAVTVRAVAGDFDFASDDVLEVVLAVEDAQGLTGLEFSLVYPADLLAVEEPTSHTLGGLFSHAFVNHDADVSGLPAGSKRISVAFAVASPITATAGTLLTVSFPLRCSDFSGGWPDGRPVTIDVQDAAAWVAQASELPAPVAVTPEGSTANVDCTTVPVRGQGFSTLKARHTGRGGSR